LWALLLQIEPRAEVAWISESATMRGCHSWVDLETPLSTPLGAPVVAAAQLSELAESLDLVISNCPD
jgi:hypothetical protein